MRPGLLHPVASQIIAQGEINHNQQPDETSGDEDPSQPGAVADVHEDENNEEHFRDGDGEGGDDVEGSEVELSDAPGVLNYRSNEEWIVSLFFRNGRYRAVTGADQGLVGKREDVFADFLLR